MPKTSDGREFPYTSDGIRAAQAHQRMLDKQKNQKTMGRGMAGDKTTGMPSIPFKARPGPSEPDESYKGYRGGGAAPKVPPKRKRSTDAGLIDLLPFSVAENIRDNEKYGDALGMYSHSRDYDPNSYQKAVKRAAIAEFKRRRGAR